MQGLSVEKESETISTKPLKVEMSQATLKENINVDEERAHGSAQSIESTDIRVKESETSSSSISTNLMQEEVVQEEVKDYSEEQVLMENVNEMLADDKNVQVTKESDPIHIDDNDTESVHLTEISKNFIKDSTFVTIKDCNEMTSNLDENSYDDAVPMNRESTQSETSESDVSSIIQCGNLSQIDLSIVKTEVMDDDNENVNQENSTIEPENSAQHSASNDQEGLENMPIKIKVKGEPIDAGYGFGQVSLMYRSHGPIVVYSDTSSEEESEDDVVDSTVCSAEDEGSDGSEDEEEAVIKIHPGQNSSARKRLCATVGEKFPEDLPKIGELTVAAGENVELEPLGEVSGIVDVLVVVKAHPFTPALYDDTVLFSEERKPLGLVFETFGTVERPYYSIRFNTHKDIGAKEIKIGDTILYAPRANNLTKYVFLKELQSIRHTDASWADDIEVPSMFRDFSDDEEEKRARGKRKNNDDQTERMNSQDPVEKQTRRSRRHKRKNRENTAVGRGGLLQGDLNKNPFGDQNQSFRPSTSSQQSHHTAPSIAGSSQSQTFHRNGPPPLHSPAMASFGGAPQWQNHPVCMGHRPPHPSGPFTNGQAPFANGHRLFTNGQGPFGNTHGPFFFPPSPGLNPMFPPNHPGELFPMPPQQSVWLRPPMFNPRVPPPPTGPPAGPQPMFTCPPPQPTPPT